QSTADPENISKGYTQAASSKMQTAPNNEIICSFFSQQASMPTTHDDEDLLQIDEDAEEGGVADYNNIDPTIDVPSTPTLRIHKIHPQSQIIGKSTAGVQTRRKPQEHGMKDFPLFF
ncbi:hypothetical protein Tco_0391955, partial [Tanacetum coccineum]